MRGENLFFILANQKRNVMTFLLHENSNSSGQTMPSVKRAKQGTFQILLSLVLVCGGFFWSKPVIASSFYCPAPVFTYCPSDVTAECDKIPALINPVVDPVCGPVTLSLNETTTPGACAHNYIITRTWTAVDANGNSSQCTQKVTIQDTTPPLVYINKPGFINGDTLELDCDALIPSFSKLNVVAFDNCSKKMNIEFVRCTFMGDCLTDGYFQLDTYYIKVTDECGNYTIYETAVKVTDNEPPVISGVPDDITLDCGTLIPDLPLVNVNDNCSPYVSLLIDETTTPGNCSGSFILTRTWTATDQCGNVATEQQKITVVDTKAPVLVNVPANVTINCDAAIPVPANVSATDNCSTNVAVHFSESTQSGNCPQSYTIIRTWTATDDCGNSAQATQKISVVDVVPPVFTYVPVSGTIECSVPLTGLSTDAKASDNCDNKVDISYHDVTIPGKCPSEYTLIRTFTAKDDCGNSSTAVQQINVVDTTKPLVEFKNPIFAGMSAGDTLSLECGTYKGFGPADFTFFDNCDQHPEFKLVENIIVNQACYKLLKCIVTVTDACGNVGSLEFFVEIKDTMSPILSNCPPSVTIECDQPLPAIPNVKATDGCNQQPVVHFTENTLPGNCPQEKTILRTWTADDLCGNTAQCSQTISVQDTKAPQIDFKNPIFTGLSEGDTVKVECGVFNGFGPDDFTITDNCDPNPVFDMVDIFIVNTPCYKLLKCIATVTDACGNATEFIFYVEVTDTQAPVLANCPANITIECDQPVPSAANVTATDACDPHPKVNFTENTLPGKCPQEKTIVRTWTAVDACGNTAQCSQSISVQDTKAPVIHFNPANPLFTNFSEGDTVKVECGVFGGFTPDDFLVTDNCDPHPVFDMVDIIIINTPCHKFLKCVASATDACGNVGQLIYYVDITDTQAPVLANCPANITIECDQPVPSAANVTATDACDPHPKVNFTENTLPGNCPQEKTIVRTWTAVDACGNTAQCSQSISVQDTKAPVISINIPGFTNGDTITVDCGAPIPAFNKTNVVVTDNCSTDIDVEFCECTYQGDCETTGFYELITYYVKATDECGNSSIFEFSVKVIDNTPPLISGVPDDVTVSCAAGLPSLPTVTADDECSETVQLTFAENTAPGKCSGEKIITRTWTAVDECGNVATDSQVIQIIDDTPPTLVNVPSDLTISCDVTIVPAGNVSATDDCSTNATVSVDEKHVPGSCANSYTIVRVFTATDDCGNTAQATWKIFVVDEKAPVFTNVPASITVECSDPVPAPDQSAAAKDNCDPDVDISHIDAAVPGNCPQEYTIIRTFIATDNCGNTVTAVQEIKVKDTTAPGIQFDPSNPLFAGFSEGDTVKVACGTFNGFGPDDFILTDNCDPNPVFDMVDIFIVNTPCYKLLKCIASATDACGNVSQLVFYVEITDTQAPVLANCPVDITIECDQPVPPAANVTATDACDPAPKVNFTENSIPGNCPQEKTIIRTWTAVDECGNTSSCSHKIEVQDTKAPEYTLNGDLTGVPNGDTLIIDCNGVLTMDMKSVMFTDNCDPDVPSIFTETLQSGDCQKDGYITFLECTWTGTDDCGNSTSYTIYIKVVDNTPPVITNCPADITVDCGVQIPPAGQLTATDDCDQDVKISFTENVHAGKCAGDQIVERTYTATDDCGNTATCKQIITRTDNEAPVITGVGQDVTIECGQALPDPGKVYTTDNCDPNPVLKYSVQHTPGQCAGSYVEIRTWQATDACGNTAVKTQKVTVQDTKAPHFAGLPASLTVECSDPITDLGKDVKAVDDCDQDVAVTFKDITVPGKCAHEFTIIRTFAATDDCGNTVTAIQEIKVKDTTPPVIDFDPSNPLFAGFNEGDTVKVECGVFKGFGPDDFILTDNCDPHPVFDMVDIFIVNTPCYKLLKCIASATDACGNVSELVFYVEMTDNLPPVFDNCPSDLVIECDQPVPPSGKVTATDACDPNAEVHFTQSEVPGKCANEKTIIRTWTAKDHCGNTAVCVQKIEVKDTKAPEYILTGPLVGVAFGDTLVLGCDEQLTMDMKSVNFVDNCDPDVPSIFTETLLAGDCQKDGFVTLLECTWTGTDDCGNATAYTIYIKVVDKKVPILSGVPANITVDLSKGEQIPGAPKVTASDNCDLDVDVTYQEVVDTAHCGGHILRTWTATDDCGNVAQATQVITVVKDCPCIDPVIANIKVKDADCGDDNGRVEIVISNGANNFEYEWIPDAGVSIGAGNIREGLPAGNYTVLVKYPSSYPCITTLNITVKGTGGNIIAEDTLIVANAKCNKPVPVCLGLNVLEVPNYDIYDNGVIYTGNIAGCDFDTVMSYTYATIPGMGQNGPYVLDSWVVNGLVLTGEFDNLNALVALMNVLDPQGNWALNTTTLSITGGSKAKVYGQMKISKKVGSSKATLDINIQLIPNGTSLNLSTGAHEIVLVNKATHCSDAVYVKVFCLTPNIVNVKVFVTETKQVCVDNSQLQGTPVSIANVCGNLSGEFSLVNITSTGYCVNITGIEPGIEKACIVVCDDLGFCDTTYINITVYETNLKPIAVDDYLTASAGKSKTVQVLANDIFADGLLSMKVISSPTTGKVTSFIDKVVVVTPDKEDCQPMVFDYEICNQYGCDTGTVHVNVLCKGLIIYNGMTPNNDGLNDYFTIDGIEDYPNNELSVYNRWGNMVYSAKAYNNNWDGSWNGKLLPDGTYYYILKDGEGESYNGYLQISR